MRHTIALRKHTVLWQRLVWNRIISNWYTVRNCNGFFQREKCRRERKEQGQAEPMGYDEEFCLFSLSAVKGALWLLFESGLERVRMETDLQEGGWNERYTDSRTRGHDGRLDLEELQEEEFKMPPQFSGLSGGWRAMQFSEWICWGG